MSAIIRATTLLLAGLTGLTASSTSSSPDTASVLSMEQALASALRANDADATSRLLGNEWTVVSTHGAVADRAGFLDVIRSGQFSRKTLDLDETHVVRDGDVAVVTTRVKTSGMIFGKPFNVTERETDVWVWRNARWSAFAMSEVEIRS